jgi:hypothetical protein
MYSARVEQRLDDAARTLPCRVGKYCKVKYRTEADRDQHERMRHAGPAKAGVEQR